MSINTNMEGGRSWLDASSYMFIEASGDSESEYCDTAEVETVIAAAVDDAESCSCGSLSSACSENVRHESNHDHGGSGDDFLGDSGEDDDGFCTSEVEDGVVDQCRGGATTAAAELNKSNKGCEDSNMNEREMDRLFWEACLAS